MAIFRNPSKNLDFSKFWKHFSRDCLNSAQGHKNNSFYPNHITDATMKIHWKWLPSIHLKDKTKEFSKFLGKINAKKNRLNE